MRLPKGILFDLGDTVLHQETYRPMAGLRRLLEISRRPPGLDVRAFLRAGCRMAAEIEDVRARLAAAGFDIVELRIQSSLRLLLESFGLDSACTLPELELEFWKAASRMHPEPGIHDALRLAADLRIPTGLVSNSIFSGHVIEWELARHGLAGQFQFVMASSDFGIRKPHPALFQTAVRKLGLRPADVWFVGDLLETDVRGASAAGLVPVWYNRRARQRDSRGEMLQAGTWEEFHGLLEAMAPNREDLS